MCLCRQYFFFQAEDGIRGAQESGGLGDVYRGQVSVSVAVAVSLCLCVSVSLCICVCVGVSICAPSRIHI